jgi:hypothetical protein
MTGQKKHTLLALAFAALVMFLAGCSDGIDTTGQPAALTKEDVKEAVKDGVEEASKPRWDVSEEEHDRIRAQMKGYSAEDEERKKAEAQRKYEEWQRKEEEREKTESALERDR